MFERIPPAARVQSGNLDALDALRGLLATIVVFAHAWQTLIVPAQTSEYAASGWWAIGIGLAAKLAVFSFFTLSGYVIALSTARNVEKNGSFGVSEFALSRAFRILPPLLIVITATIAIQFVLGALGFSTAPAGVALSRQEYQVVPLPTAKCLLSLCATGTLVRDVNGPLWSLEAELQLYVISGLLMWLTYNRRYRMLIAGALLLYILMSFRPIRDGMLTIQPASFAAFACGWFMQRGSGFFSTRALGLLTMAGGAACVAVLALATHEELLHLNGGVVVSLAFLFYAIASAGAIQLLAGKGTPRWAADTGAFSYTLYIFHFPLLLAASFILYHVAPDLMRTHTILIALLVGCAVIAICAIVGRMIERPKAQRRFVMDRLRPWRPAPAERA